MCSPVPHHDDDDSRDTEAGHAARKDTPRTAHNKEDPLPPDPPYLWTSAVPAYQDQEFRFSGFEPCYIACIKDLEWQIKRKVQTVDFTTENAGLAGDMAPMLLQYSQLVDALDSMERRDRVFEEDYLGNPDDKLYRFSGTRRRVSRADRDKVHDHLRQNVILVVLGYIYTWDLADQLKRRFGNLTKTLDRLLVGISGGAALLVPMIMMTFLTTRTARLIIVSVATLLFVITLSFTTTSRDAVMSATAAYAAVMVVFIGSSLDTAG